MIDSDITIESGDVELAGTFTRPDGEGPFPAALLIAGSGPLDRDGDHPKLPLSVSKDLARILTEEGWASVRFDKRGIGSSTGDYLSTGLHEEFADAEAALTWLLGRTDVGPVVVIGHSVGALCAAEMSTHHPELAGAVLLAYTAKDGDSTLRWQAGEIAETLPGWVRAAMKLFFTNVEKQQAKAIARLRRTTADTARIQGQKINAKWMREFLDYDPEPILRMTRTPLFAITGSKDVQVDADDLDVVAAVAGDRATTVLAIDVDHILRHDDAAVSNPNTYRRQLAKPIDPSVVDPLLAWLRDVAPSTREDEQDRGGVA